MVSPWSNSCSTRGGILQSLCHSFLGGLRRATKCNWIIVLVHRFPDCVQLFSQNLIVAGMVAALLTRQSMTTDFTDSGWWEINCIYVFSVVCSFTINFSHGLPVFMTGEMSVKSNDQSFSSSMVNLMMSDLFVVCV